MEAISLRIFCKVPCEELMLGDGFEKGRFFPKVCYKLTSMGSNYNRSDLTLQGLNY